MSNIVRMKDGDHSYLFYADSRMSEKRAQTMFIKEEGTIAWLKTMGDQDVLYDVGANIGLYTVLEPRGPSRYMHSSHTWLTSTV